MKVDPKRKWSAKRGEGEVVKWLEANVGHDQDECLIFPFGRNAETGYGTFGHLGELRYAHRYMCELKHGPAPLSGQYAVHSCGNGHGGCVNPKHIAWDTSAGNASDRVFHGRQNKKGDPRNKLTQKQAEQIRALKGIESQYDIARGFNISRETVAQIHQGVAWTGKPMRHGVRLSSEDRARIALRARQMHKEGVSYMAIAKEFDITRGYASRLARGKYRGAPPSLNRNNSSNNLS